MQRGCVITIISSSLVILVAAVILRIFYMPDIQSEGTSRIIYVIESAMEEHNKDHDSYPAGGNEAITKTLLGSNPRGKKYLTDKSVVIRDGMMVDLWKQPFKIVIDNSIPLFISAGNNGVFHDDDDISSKMTSNEIKGQTNRP